MYQQKNRIMLRVSFIIALISIVIQVLSRYFQIFDHFHSMSADAQVSMVQLNQEFGVAITVLLALPLLLCICAYLIFRKSPDHPLVAWLNMLVLTASSISMIAGGGGKVEFHFSIFMVVAFMFYYEQIRLVLTMTALFAVQHIVGFFLTPELVFGVREYSFSMLLVHALFLLFTSSAICLQIRSNHTIRNMLQAEKEGQRGEILQDVVTRLSLTAEKIAGAAKRLSQGAEESIHSSQSITFGMEQIAAGSHQQAQQTVHTTQSISEMDAGIQHISAAAVAVSLQSAQTEEKVEKGHQSLQQLVQQMMSLQQTVGQSESSIKTLHGLTTEISNITHAITDIASQTNLLALNAAIEAARAGEHGRGFAIVADEVRKLAEEAGASAKKIIDLVGQIEGATLSSVTSIDTVTQDVASSIHLIHRTEDAFTDLLQLAREAAEQIREISAFSEQLRTNSLSVAATIAGMSQVSEEFATHSAQAKETAERQLQSLMSGRESILSFNQMVDELLDVIHQIKTQS
ncbi:MAG TPA: methyl-accepting chemotaxis protein [Candidatus Bathyarchaeia archaeon]|nr:methyl-accepting chemotaxis protein [Candidatus Bathyarchaeia archaeon]